MKYIRGTQKCDHCNEIIKTSPPINGRYCSRKCLYLAGQERKNKQIIQVICAGCGKEFTSIKASIKKYCSLECQLTYRKKPRDVKFNSYILPPFSELKKEDPHVLSFNNRTLSTWLLPGFSENIKEAVLKRDGYKCYICGKETRLHVHHITSRTRGGRHTLENLITLCAGCHRSVEAGDVENAVFKCVRRALDNI